ncbi:MAG: purine-binding chemotaxis protein CheW [Ruminococcus sp.]|nr:purine-binding chemotaxis protein CheW [Ruminococcus sp.]
MQEYQDYFDYEEEAKDVRTFLEFVISNKIFAIETFEVIEIVQMEDYVTVPEFPEYVKGIITVKDSTLAVIDTAKRFKYEENDSVERRCVIICKAGEKRIGLLADNVLKIRDVETEKVLSAPEINKEAFTRYITGMFIRSSGEPCFVVSPEKMMSEDEVELIP